MVLNLKFCRFDNVPWGFRLTGGTDFELPLTVIKVTKGSIAEETGLKVGDVVVRINDTAMSNLDHKQAHEVIMRYGSTFVMGVIRPDEDGLTEDINEKIANGKPCDLMGYEYECQPSQPTQTPDSQTYSDMSEMTINTMRTTSQNDDVSHEITDEHIAEMMSGEAEVLKEHNIIGVNFQRIMPKSGLFKSSEVFKHLNQEATKTKAEREQEVKRWTTFLQKPDRPVPKCKQDFEDERRHIEGYKIEIKKQPKPKCDPNRIPTPPPIKEPTPQLEPEPEIRNEPNIVIIIDDLPGDTEVPDLEGTPLSTEVQQEQTESSENKNKEPEPEPVPEPVKEEKQPEKTEEELLIEKQLSDVQKQLLALSHLPLTIQATLDAVTKQLADIMPVLKLQTQLESKDLVEQKNEEKVDQSSQNEEGEKKQENENKSELSEEPENAPIETQIAETQEKEVTESDPKESPAEEEKIEAKTEEQRVEEKIENKVEENVNNEVAAPPPPPPPPELTQDEIIAKQKCQKIFKKQEEEWMTKREKEQKQLQAELNKKVSNRLPRSNGGPLTPQQRPLVLPGGRKWRNERDAYNEEFIKEIISSQAELIVGSTLGESNCPMIDRNSQNEVNFLKYKKPEKDLSNLKSSEVFKIIHNLEREPKHGIQVRPAKVLAETDIRNGTPPISCL